MSIRSHTSVPPVTPFAHYFALISAIVRTQKLCSELFPALSAVRTELGVLLTGLAAANRSGAGSRDTFPGSRHWASGVKKHLDHDVVRYVLIEEILFRKTAFTRPVFAKHEVDCSEDVRFGSVVILSYPGWR